MNAERPHDDHPSYVQPDGSCRLCQWVDDTVAASPPPSAEIVQRLRDLLPPVEPTGIRGKVTGLDVEASLVEVTEDDGRVWSIRGHRKTLRDQIERLRVGDSVAVRYFGRSSSEIGLDVA